MNKLVNNKWIYSAMKQGLNIDFLFQDLCISWLGDIEKKKKQN